MNGSQRIVHSNSGLGSELAHISTLTALSGNHELRQPGVIGAVGFFDPLGIAREGIWSPVRQARTLREMCMKWFEHVSAQGAQAHQENLDRYLLSGCVCADEAG